MRQKLFVLYITLLFLFSVLIQVQIYQDWDMLFLLEGGKRLLAGGSYVNDMFENNPPLIYYFSIWINFLADIFNLNSIFVFKLYIYMFILYSLATSYYLLNFKSVKSPVTHYLLLTLAFCLLILSACCFGERDHLMLILAMPYYFLLYCTASDIKVKPVLRVIISLLAALGFALKPYFLFNLIIPELLFMYWQRSWKTIFRLETFIILGVMVTYLVSIAIFTPDFYSDILPYLARFYVFNNNMSDVLSNLALVNALILLLSTLFLSIYISRMETLVITVLLSCLLSFILQGKGWYYHAFPLITMNVLLATLLISHLLTLVRINRIYSVLLFLIIVAQFLFTLVPALNDYHQKTHFYKSDTSSFRKLTQIARSYAQNKKIFFFSTDLSIILPVIYYSDAKLGSRFPTLWLLSGIINRQERLKKCDEICLTAKKQIINYITEDFKHYQPELVYVDIGSQKLFMNAPVDYLLMMNESSAFQTIWQKYCYLINIKNFAIYRRCEKGH